MNDPYPPLEAERQLTRRALEVIAAQKFPVQAITKSDLILRDRDLLRAISRVNAAVSFTITIADDALSKRIDPARRCHLNALPRCARSRMRAF